MIFNRSLFDEYLYKLRILSRLPNLCILGWGRVARVGTQPILPSPTQSDSPPKEFQKIDLKELFLYGNK